MLKFRMYYQDLKDNDEINYILSSFHPNKVQATVKVSKDLPDIVHLKAISEAATLLTEKMISMGQTMPENPEYTIVVGDVL